VIKAVYARKLKGHVIPVDVAIKVMTRSENIFAGYDKICREALKEANQMESARRSVDCKNNIIKLLGVVQGALPRDIISLFNLRTGDEAIGLVMQYFTASASNSPRPYRASRHRDNTRRFKARKYSLK
jgi:hypothetical protein